MAPIPETHSVYRLASRNSYNDIQLHTEPVPKPLPHEVLIKIRGVALNYRDIAVSNSTYPFSAKDNLVPCSDGAGIVAATGTSVTEFQVGDQVIGSFDLKHFYGPRLTRDQSQGATFDGVLREYITLPEISVTRIPQGSGLSFVEMACLVCGGVTAWNALFGNLPMRPGQSVLFIGTGGVSLIGLVLAKAAGAVTIITSSSDEKLAFVKEKYGVDHVINYKKTPDWATEARDLTGGRGVDFVFENGGSGTIKQSLECIAMGGIIALIGFLVKASQEDMPDVAALVLKQGCMVRGISVGSKQLMGELVNFVVAKKLHMPVDKVFGFSREEVIKAFEFLDKGGQTGKVCISLE